MADYESKTPNTDYLPPREDEEALTLERDWTVEEEKKAKRKLDLIIMPILTMGFFCLQLDRGNIANAITDNFMKDLKITQDQFNVGQQMLSLGIVLFEIPSNMILYRVGPGKWLTLQLFLFGIVSLFQAFQNNYASFILTRFLLGMTESGFIPGGLWTLSTCNQFSQASSKLLAYGILHMRGVGGKSGWFWLFTLMGSFTVLGGVVFGLFLPDSFRNPHSTFLPSRNVFSEREIHILRSRVVLDDPMKGKKKKSIGLPAFKKAFSNWRLCVHVVITLCNNGPQRAFDTYSPTIVGSFCFTGLSSNALASVGLFLQIPVSFSFSYVSDHFNRRGETVMTGLGMHALGYIFNRGFTELKGVRGVKYFGVVFTQTFGTFSHPLNIAWMSLTCSDSEERALAMAMVIMGANIAGIYGAQILRADDKPKYRRGFSINIAVLVFALILAFIRFIDDKFLRPRREAAAAAIAREREGSISDQNSSQDEKIAALPSDVQPQPILIGSDAKIVATSAIAR